MCAPSMQRCGRILTCWSWNGGMSTRVPTRAALLVHEQIAEAALDRARRSFQEKLSFFGSRLETARAVPGNPQALAQAIRDEQRAGARLLVLAGSRSMDPQDPVLQALEL